MLYSDIASLHEHYYYGRKNPLKDALRGADDKHILDLATILFAERCEVWSFAKMVSHVARTTEVFPDVVLDVVKTKEGLIENLVSESGNAKRWSVSKAASMMIAFTKQTSPITFLDIAKQINQVEARLFWRTVLGARKRITKETFLRAVLRNGVDESVFVRGRLLGDNIELHDAIHTMLHTPERFNDDSFTIYVPRRVKAWKNTLNLTDYNGGLCQLIEGKGNRVIEHTDDCVVEKSKEGQIYDVFFPDEPDLSLIDRLSRLGGPDVLMPISIPSWSTIEDWAEQNTVRFPNTSPYDVQEEGAHILVLDYHIHPVRLSWYKAGEIDVEMGIEVLDGTDFFQVGSVRTTNLDDTSYVYRALKRYDVNELPNVGVKYELPPHTCVVMSISSPSFNTTEMCFEHAIFHQIENNMGIGDLTQLVDMMVME
ncbi:MAG: hypothetical protein EB165_06470 [Euryarchaeota archaeon]|nr:hypothetical protein [Euryarchaeota archaeon]NDB94268.1 hypothetical protein [Euryarchaeota archaeon]